METKAEFNVISLNVRGLGSLNKRRGIFLWLNKQKADIVFLQETIVHLKMKCNGKARRFFHTAPIIVKVL